MVNPYPASEYGAGSSPEWRVSTPTNPCRGMGHTWDSPTGIELACVNLVDPDTFCGGKVFSKYLHYLHYLHWPKLSENMSSFGKQCTFGKSLLHCCCTICTICPRWRESIRF